MPAQLALAATLIVAPLMAGSAPPNSSDGGRITAEMASVMNYMNETCVELEPGHALVYEFNSAYAVDFNIHHHTPTTTEFPVKLTVNGHHDGRLELPDGGEYCFMWSNPANQPDAFVIELAYRAEPID